MKARVIPLRDISAADQAAWKALAGRAAEPNPFFEPECLVPAAIHQRFGDELQLVMAEEGGRAYACIPVRAVWRYPDRFPYPFVTTQVRRTIECGTPLIDAEHGEEGLVALLSTLSENRRALRSRVLTLPKVTTDGPVFRFLRSAARKMRLPFVISETWERGLLKCRQDPPYEQHLSRNLRSQIRRKRRQYSDEFGTTPTLVDRTADNDAAQRYLEIEGAGHKSQTGVAMITEPGEPEFFSHMCSRFASEGRLRVFTLEAGCRTLAMEVWLQRNEGTFLFKLSYDERISHYDPGNLLLFAALEGFYTSSGHDWVDSCTGPNSDSTLRLFPNRRQSSAIYIPLSKNPVDLAAVHGFLALRPLYRRVFGVRQQQIPR